MKKSFFIALMVMIIGITSAFAADFISQTQIKADIENYYKERTNIFSTSLYLLDIISSEEDSNWMYVYFLEGQDPSIAKDMDDNINSSSTRVMVAIYTFGYLKSNWRLWRIEQASGGLMFKID